jgi:hypothetical protein
VAISLRDDESQRRLAEVLTEIAVAAIHPARHLGVGRSSSGEMLEDPIRDVTHAAVERLVSRLEDLVESLPPRTIDELANEQVVAEHGVE